MKIYIQIEQSNKTLLNERVDTTEEAKQVLESFEYEYAARQDEVTDND
tara:strand:+ start:3438 stop:3581 length:144 start_codon:yes stop_codon:yes gene_type:complete